MNYISNVFSPRVNLTRLGDKEIAEVLPPMENFKHKIRNKVMVKYSRFHKVTRIFRSGSQQSSRSTDRSMD